MTGGWGGDLKSSNAWHEDRENNEEIDCFSTFHFSNRQQLAIFAEG